MKKKIRSEITALAKQIMATEDELSIIELKKYAQTLYERLSVLAYLESQIEGEDEVLENHALDSKSFREENWFNEPVPLPRNENKEELVEPAMEKIKDIIAQIPDEFQQVEQLLEAAIPKQSFFDNNLEEFASNYRQTPVFERKEPTKGGEIPQKTNTLIPDIGALQEKPKSINESLKKGLQIGLNDRLAFIKHLFDGRDSDFSRVISQVSTMSSFDDAESFINGQVKPDYNYWQEKEEFSERFMSMVQKSFE